MYTVSCSVLSALVLSSCKTNSSFLLRNNSSISGRGNVARNALAEHQASVHPFCRLFAARGTFAFAVIDASVRDDRLHN